MKRKRVQAGNSLAVTARPGVKLVEGGKVTRAFSERAARLMKRRAALYEALAK